MAIWEQQFDTQCRIRRAVIVHGNVQDIFWDDATGQTGVSIVDHIRGRLERLGYADVVRWDSHSGASVATDKDSTRNVLSEMAQAAAAGPSATAPKTTGKAYNLGLPTTGGVPNAPAVTDPMAALKTPASFFSALLHRFQFGGSGQPVAFIVDGGDALFGDSRSFSEAERELLLLLSRSLRESKCSLDGRALSSNEDLLVLITPKLGFIPPRFYQDNPAVADVPLPRPERPDREVFMRKALPALWVKEPISPDSRDFADLVDALDGFSYRDMQQLARLSRHDGGQARLSWKRLVQLYRYGQSSSPWEDLDRKKLDSLVETLRAQVKGQEHVIDRIRDVVVNAYMGLSGLQHSARQQRPKGIFFFVGPTGVGKTETAKALARFLFGEEEACLRFDMSEYSAEHSDQRLVGAPPGYVGYEEGGQLTNAVRRRPFSVILFDEIEKAHPKIFDKFLQVLEDGRLTDGKGDTVSFSESVLVFTSNIGASEIRANDSNPNEKFVEAVRRHFRDEMKRPELLNRIGEANILPFNFLTDETVLLKILEAKLKPLRDKLAERWRIDLEFEDQDAALRTVMSGFSVENGGRGVANLLNERIIEPLAKRLFEEDEADLRGARVVVKVGPDGSFRFRINRAEV
jgi:hypothetical protein